VLLFVIIKSTVIITMLFNLRQTTHMLDLDPMTLIPELDLDSRKNFVLKTRFQVKYVKIRAQTRHTDTLISR